jgi:hypothetical protein
MTRAERAVLTASRARALCLSLRRAYAGPRALERLRAGEAGALSPDELRLALGLAWAAGDAALMRRTFERLPRAVVKRDPVLGALEAACGASR